MTSRAYWLQVGFGSVKHKNQDTVTVQAFYLSNPHKLMDIRQSGPLLKAAAHTGQCTLLHLHKSLRDSYFSSKSSISPFVNEPSWLGCMSGFCLKGVSSIGFLLQVFGLDSQYWVNEISTLNKKRLQTFAKPQNLSNDKGNKKELSDTGVPGREPLSKGVACDKD